MRSALQNAAHRGVVTVPAVASSTKVWGHPWRALCAAARASAASVTPRLASPEGRSTVAVSCAAWAVSTRLQVPASAPVMVWSTMSGSV